MSEWTVLLEELWSQRIGKKKTCTALWNICRKMNNSRERNTSIDVTEHTNVITQIRITDCNFVIFSWASQTEVMEQGRWEKLPSSVQIVNPPANNLFFRLLQLEKKWQEICVSTFKTQASYGNKRARVLIELPKRSFPSCAWEYVPWDNWRKMLKNSRAHKHSKQF